MKLTNRFESLEWFYFKAHPIFVGFLPTVWGFEAPKSAHETKPLVRKLLLCGSLAHDLCNFLYSRHIMCVRKKMLYEV